jgi:hypothetical protein
VHAEDIAMRGFTPAGGSHEAIGAASGAVVGVLILLKVASLSSIGANDLLPSPALAAGKKANWLSAKTPDKAMVRVLLRLRIVRLLRFI